MTTRFMTTLTDRIFDNFFSIKSLVIMNIVAVRLFFLGLLLALMSPTVFSQSSDGFSYSGEDENPAWFVDSFLDMAEDLAEAKAQGKKLVVYFFQNSCPYCAALIRKNFSQPDIVRTMQDNFMVVAMNMWGSREVVDLQGVTTTEKDFAKRLKVQFTPTLLFFADDGSVLLRANGYYPPHRFRALLDYVIAGHASKESLHAYIKRTTPNKPSGKLDRLPQESQTPLNFVQAKAKPTMVIVSQKDCASCQEFFSGVLSKPKVVQAMQAYDVKTLDIWDNKTQLIDSQGQTTTVANWAKALNIHYTPTFILFTKDNKEVFRSDARLMSFHTESALDWVSQEVYVTTPEFQRFILERAQHGVSDL